jgi:RHS repeat-associated protein
VITTSSDLNNNDDNLLTSKLLYDGLGRTTESRQYEGGTNYIATQQQYDALGRAYKTSNPFRPWQAETAVWTTAAFDALGRVVSVTTPDSAMANTSYLGNSVTVTDQAGKARKSVTDALGRLITIYEDPSVVNYQTGYTYDVLGNLIGVTQGVQTRTFVYDSLRRLTSATNPESGTISYTYDNNGNMLTRFDARSVTANMAYDALNRPTSRSYNDTPQTPAVNYFYDSQTLPSGAPSYDRGNSTGRLVAMTFGSGSSEGTYRGYDQLGRTVRKYQRTDSVNYLIEASYFANGAIQNETYPSVPGAGDRRVISGTNDSAGRLASISSSATSYAPAATVNTISYASHNGLASETLGNDLIHGVSYNNRLQPNETKLGTSGAPTSLLSIAYNYGTANNNGNVLSTTYNGGGLTYTQSFGYDALNRLTTSVENGGASWSQTNGYDRYGNRWIDLGGGTQNLYFNTSNNRINGGSYDNGGNLLNDGLHTYTYDGENKISKVDGVLAYVYDGEGQRVRKLVGENRRFVYGIAGELISEFDGSTGSLQKEYIYGADGLVATIEPNAVNSNGTRYLVSDHLGSPRVITNSAAGVVSRHDYKPFGEELSAGVGGRTAGMGFGIVDGVRQKFTSYERDSESGLDFAGARFYSSGQGRFTSVDPLMASAVTGNPQTFNRYTYVLNSPLTLTDPTGMSAVNSGGASGTPHVTLFLNDQTSQQPQPQAPAGPPPPGGPVTLGPIKIDVGPVPLPEGQEPWPTSLEAVYSDNKTYNGERLLSPSGIVIDEEPNYGVGRTADYIIRDQAGNPMSTGVLLKEEVSAGDSQTQALMKDVEVNKNPQRPDGNGIVPDTLGFISRDLKVVQFLQQNQVDATFKQTIKVYGAVAQEYRTALTVNNVYRATNAGVTVTGTTVVPSARPK